jgi:predicted MPP superfamily phosphohydrolase
LYATQVEPFWLDLHEFALPVVGLPKAFEGFRIAHLSDLHMGDHLPLAYLQKTVARLNLARPNVVMLTGDVLHESPDWIDRAAELLGSIKSPVIVSLGNHDYTAFDDIPNFRTELALALVDRLTRAGCTVLRNHALSLEQHGEKLTVVGLDDLWSGRFNPATAHASAATLGKAPLIVMSHNPDTIQHLLPFAPMLILCGHTHGGQVRIPGWGAILLPVTNRHFDRGLFTLGATRVYVSRGVGYLRRIRFCCRPELPIHVLRTA